MHRLDIFWDELITFFYGKVHNTWQTSNISNCVKWIWYHNRANTFSPCVYIYIKTLLWKPCKSWFVNANPTGNGFKSILLNLNNFIQISSVFFCAVLVRIYNQLLKMCEITNFMVNYTSPRHLLLLHTIAMTITADGSNTGVLVSTFDGSIVAKCIFH